MSLVEQQKTAGIVDGIGRAVGRMSRAAAPSAVAGTAGYVAAPYLQQASGITSDTGKTTHQIGNALAWGLAAAPRFRGRAFNRDTTAASLLKLQRGNSQLPIGNFPNTQKFAPIRGAVNTLGVVAAPTTLGAMTDRTKRVAEGIVKSIDANPEIINNPLGTVREKLVDPAVDRLKKEVLNPAVDRTLSQGKDLANAYLPPFAHTLAMGAGGGIGGAGIGLGAGHFLGNTLLPDDEKMEYHARRGRERARSMLRMVGVLGGGVGGMLLGQHVAGQQLDKQSRENVMAVNTNSQTLELAKTAVAAREKRAAFQKQAEGFDWNGLWQNTQKTWNGLAPEHQYGLIGAGLGGAYGAATARSGHGLEDTLYGAGIGGAGGYAGGLIANHLPPSVAKTPQEQQIAADAASKADAKKYLPPQGLGNSLASPGVTQNAGYAQAAGYAGAAGAGYVAGQSVTPGLLHKFAPGEVARGWAPQTATNEAALQQMGHTVDLKEAIKTQRPMVPHGGVPIPAMASKLPFSPNSAKAQAIPPNMRKLPRAGGFLGAGLGLAGAHFLPQMLPDSVTKPIGNNMPWSH